MQISNFSSVPDDIIRESQTGQFYPASNPQGLAQSGFVAQTSGVLQLQTTNKLNISDGLFFVAQILQRAKIYSGPYNNLRSTVAGVGTTSTVGFDNFIVNATGANAFARRDFYGQVAGTVNNGNQGGAVYDADFSRPCFTWFSMGGFGAGVSTQNDSYRAVFFGKHAATPTPGMISTKGWGFVHEGSGSIFRAVAHNGTTLFSGSPMTVSNFANQYKSIKVVMYSDGSGNLSTWITQDFNNSSTPFNLLSTPPNSVVTGAPIGSTSSDVYFAAETYAGAAGGGQNRLDVAMFGLIWG
jgi:hypothetical protein